MVLGLIPRIVLFVAAIGMVGLVAPADVSPVGSASAVCYYEPITDQCWNPCYTASNVLYKLTRKSLICYD